MAISPAGLPAAAGGVDLASALVSTTPGIRRLKKISVTEQLGPAFAGGEVPLKFPKSSYIQKATVQVRGTLRIVQPGAPVSITATDPRRFLQTIRFALSGSTNVRVLTGVQEDIIDNLDVPVVPANTQVYAAGPAGAGGSTTDTPLRLTWGLRLSVSPQNLYGIPYMGGEGTVPRIELTFADPAKTLAIPGGAGASVTLENGVVEMSTWRIDLPGPIAPTKTPMVQDGKTVMVETGGQGLFHEASYILLTRMYDAEDLSGPGSTKKFELPTGGDYLRLVLLAWKGGVLDDESAPLIDNASIVIQQATSIETKKLWEFDEEYRETYYKNRPKGVYPFSGIDSTGTDADLYVTRELGNFDVEVVCTDNPVPANSRLELLTQELRPLTTPGVYA